ncbi:MAG: hypothetical protein ACRDOY_02570 [Nocardioidaceae bacterium]
MSTTATNTRRQLIAEPDTSAGRPWRLCGRLRKIVLVVHIVSAGAWVGIDLVVAVLVLTGWLTDDVSVRAVAYQALGLFVVWPMFVSALVCLASGVLLGLGSRYGLLRYWWVAVKLVMNIVLCTLVLALLRPGLADVLRHGRALAAGRSSDLDVSFLFFPPAVSLTALTVATVLAVFKPWGRIRRTASRQ